MSFAELGLHAAQVRACESLGYTEPTPIQKRAIPVVLTGADLIGCAETGTGKTAAFLLPAIQRMAEQPRPGVRLLVLAPTRELAMQIGASYRELAPKKGAPRCATLIGGTGMARQTESLRRGVGVIIATPGRLLDHMERGAVDFRHLEILVLDEADRMLDMGFLPQIRRVLDALPKERQTLLFSATMSPEIERLARTTMHSPEIVEVSRRGRAAATVEQAVYPVAMESKTALLLDLLERDRDVFERVRPVLEVLGRPSRVGGLGAGAAMKLVMNSTLGVVIVGIAEALALGAALGLEEGAVLDALQGSYLGGMVEAKRRMIETGEYPPQFRMTLAAKDLRLAEEAGPRLPGVTLAREAFEAAAAAGLGDRDYAALIEFLRREP
jgi:hypothetical protein